MSDTPRTPVGNAEFVLPLEAVGTPEPGNVDGEHEAMDRVAAYTDWNQQEN